MKSVLVTIAIDSHQTCVKCVLGGIGTPTENGRYRWKIQVKLAGGGGIHLPSPLYVRGLRLKSLTNRFIAAQHTHKQQKIPRYIYEN